MDSMLKCCGCVVLQETEQQRKKAAENGGKPFVPVTHRTGLLGLCGKEEPSKTYYLKRIQECEEDIDFERQFVFKHGYARSYFVVFETQVRALRSSECHSPCTVMEPRPQRAVLVCERLCVLR